MSTTPASSPAKPVRKASTWGRVGAAVRRSTTLLAPSRSTTPAPTERDSDSISISKHKKDTSDSSSVSRQKIDTSPATLNRKSSAVALPTIYSAVAESSQEPLAAAAPSNAAPISQQPSTRPITPPAPAPPQAVSAVDASSPQGYVPPPLVDSRIGNPGAFTDESDTLPQTSIARDPFASSSRVSLAASNNDTDSVVAPYVPPPLINSAAGNPGAFVDEPEELAQPVVSHYPVASSNSLDPSRSNNVSKHGDDNSVHGVPLVDEPESLNQDDHQPSTPNDERRQQSFFNKPMVSGMGDSESERDIHENTPEFSAAVEQNTAISPPAPSGRGYSPIYGPQVLVPEPQRAPEYHDDDYGHRLPSHHEEDAATAPVYAPVSSVPAPVFSVPPNDYVLEHGHNVWGGKHEEHNVHPAMPVPETANSNVDNYDNNARSAPVHMPNEEPFVAPTTAPQMSITRSTHSGTVHMPHPQPSPHHAQPSVLDHEDAVRDSVVMPLPAFHEVIPNAPNPTIRRNPTDTDYYAEHDPIETDESLPLLRGTTPNAPAPYLRSHTPTHGRTNNVWVVPLSTSNSLSNDQPRPNGNTHPHPHSSVSQHPSAHPPSSANPTATFGNPSTAALHPRLHELGWLEYHLPDGTFYYVHPTRKITTDLNLRFDSVLSEVTNYLEGSNGFGSSPFSAVGSGFGSGGFAGGYGAIGGTSSTRHVEGGNLKDSARSGVEIWLRDLEVLSASASKGKKGNGTAKGKGKGKGKPFTPVKYLVDHHSRTVIPDRASVVENANGSPSGNAKGVKKGVEEDQLDMEYRYWSFMESHPAHTTLPHKGKAEAMDVLNWAWTDRLLPSHRAIPAPFSQDECQELMTLLRGFDNGSPGDHGIQTRVVSRILLRVAFWRQKYFRPNKPLPKDVSPTFLDLPSPPRRTFRRAFLDLLISLLFLGIPYLYVERTRSPGRVVDEESHNVHGTLGSGGLKAGYVLVVGACTCLVAAIVLSASVTFLSLPGLEIISRTAILVAILFASFSMASTLLSLFKYKSDIERAGTGVGLGGFVGISARAVLLSLPLVFLTYSIIAFITALTIYSLRGGLLVDPNLKFLPFEDYTRWAVVGLVGAFAGIFAMTYFAARR